MKNFSRLFLAVTIASLIFLFTGCPGFFDVISPEYQGTFEWDLNGTVGTIIAVIDGNSVRISGDSAGVNTGPSGGVQLGRHSISSAGREKVTGIGGASDSTTYVLYSRKNKRFGSFPRENKNNFQMWGFYGNFYRIK
ncbi:MAG: hypothetical protein LBH43_15275 [Treponema sp.]|jgi:hypothetical protein|nr:hypothetical protein [Treponema sp.]